MTASLPRPPPARSSPSPKWCHERSEKPHHPARPLISTAPPSQGPEPTTRPGSWDRAAHRSSGHTSKATLRMATHLWHPTRSIVGSRPGARQDPQHFARRRDANPMSCHMDVNRCLRGHDRGSPNRTPSPRIHMRFARCGRSGRIVPPTHSSTSPTERHSGVMPSGWGGLIEAYKDVQGRHGVRVAAL